MSEVVPVPTLLSMDASGLAIAAEARAVASVDTLKNFILLLFTFVVRLV